MKKRVPIVLFLIISFFGTLSFTQELKDVEVITRDATEIYLTKYGYLVEYPTSSLYKADFFVPNSWVRITREGEERGIILRRQVTYHNIDVPSFQISYLDSEVKYVTLIVPKRYIEQGFPVYYGELSDEELKAAFEDQANSTVINIK